MTAADFAYCNTVTDRERRLSANLHLDIATSCPVTPAEGRVNDERQRLRQLLCETVERNLRRCGPAEDYRRSFRRILGKLEGLSSLFTSLQGQRSDSARADTAQFVACRTIGPEHVARDSDRPLLAKDGEITRMEAQVRGTAALTRAELLWLLRCKAPGKAFGMGHMLTTTQGIGGYWMGLRDLEHGPDRRDSAMRVDTMVVAPGFEDTGAAEALCRDLLDTAHGENAIVDATARKRP